MYKRQALELVPHAELGLAARQPKARLFRAPICDIGMIGTRGSVFACLNDWTGYEVGLRTCMDAVTIYRASVFTTYVSCVSHATAVVGIARVFGKATVLHIH